MVLYFIIAMSEIDMDTKVLLKLINYNDFLIFKDFRCVLPIHFLCNFPDFGLAHGNLKMSAMMKMS